MRAEIQVKMNDFQKMIKTEKDEDKKMKLFNQYVH